MCEGSCTPRPLSMRESEPVCPVPVAIRASMLPMSACTAALAMAASAAAAAMLAGLEGPSLAAANSLLRRRLVISRMAGRRRSWGSDRMRAAAMVCRRAL